MRVRAAALRALAGLAAAIVFASAAVPAPAPFISWGKAGVSLADYRADSLACGEAGYYHDVSNSAATRTLVRASKEMNDVPQQAHDAGSVDQAVQSAETAESVRRAARPEAQFHAVGVEMQSVVDQCLTERGYRRFVLNADQQHHLAGLKAGTDARRAYLYGLANDPAVLSAQAYDGAKDAGHLRY